MAGRRRGCLANAIGAPWDGSVPIWRAERLSKVGAGGSQAGRLAAWSFHEVLARVRPRQEVERNYSPTVRTTLEIGRPSAVGSFISLMTISSYCGSVCRANFGFMNTTL